MHREITENVLDIVKQGQTWEGVKVSWKDLKNQGSAHYKTDGDVEPIDLYRAGGMFRHYALTSIIKYSFRNRNVEEPVSETDMNKIIDLAQKLIASCRA